MSAFWCRCIYQSGYYRGHYLNQPNKSLPDYVETVASVGRRIPPKVCSGTGDDVNIIKSESS
jgi:hypothetical protein